MRIIAGIIVVTSVLFLVTGTAMAPPPVRNPLDCAVSTTSVNFPSFDSSSTVNIDSEGTIILNCTCSNPPCDRQAKVMVTIGPSIISGSVNPRLMKRVGNTETLQYQLYQDAARTNIWDTSPPRNVKNEQPFIMTIYGQIPYYAARTLLPMGAYTDGTVLPSGPTVTINW